MLPTIVFVGPPKSGTSWLYEYFRAREDVCVSRDVKELFFFDRQYERGLGWYGSHFVASAGQTICVDFAPTLFGRPKAAARLAADLPEAKIVVTLRNPIERMVSTYFHSLSTGRIEGDFAAAAQRHDKLRRTDGDLARLKFWMALIDKSKLTVLLHDDMVRDLDGFCTEMCEALAIPVALPSADLRAHRVNAARKPRSSGLARLAVGGVKLLRRCGAHSLVNLLKREPFLSLAYGRSVDRQDKREALAAAKALSVPIEEELAGLEELLGRDLSAWRPEALGDEGKTP